MKILIKVHYNHIIHRDIKPQNILFDEDFIAKLADFGLSELCEEEKGFLNSTEGTYYFMAPELFANKKNIEGKPADIWALGVSFFCFAYLRIPFSGDSLNEMSKNIIEKPLEFDKSRILSNDLKEIFCKMMEKDPQKRITIEYFISIISIYFFSF